MVVALARDLGWGVQYVTDSRRSPAGWLDLYCARERDGRRLAIELKMPGRKPTPCQERWIALHNATGTLATVAYPDDWPWIVELLR